MHTSCLSVLTLSILDIEVTGRRSQQLMFMAVVP